MTCCSLRQNRRSACERFREMDDYWVYILTNRPRCTVLYIGVTNSLKVRLWQHQNGSVSKFCGRYNVHHLIYFERYPDPEMAIARESQLKGWRRSKKEALINRKNPEWRDLGEE